jgi:hypothetical protein
MTPRWFSSLFLLFFFTLSGHTSSQAFAPSSSTPTPTPTPTPTMTPVTAASAAVEQTTQGTKPAARLVESFDGLGFGFEGPQGIANLRNPSDNTLAVGPDHIVQIVNTRMAVFSKKGKRFDRTGKALYGPVVTRAVFAGFGGQCESRNNGDAVVRYDQLANRWLIVMPIFARGPVRPINLQLTPAVIPQRLAHRAARTNLDQQFNLFHRPRQIHPIQTEPGRQLQDGVPTRCVMQSAPRQTRWANTIGTSSFDRSFLIIHVRQFGSMVTTIPPAPATTLFRSTRAWSNGIRC